jgi:LysR family transcriptional regulator, glycine cleavage system transcriptional activator
MATRIPPVHALSAFEAAARHGSFALAAEELCITPSALSHRIRLLEEFVGERLFLRDGRNVGLSEFGRRYLDVVRLALRALTDFPMPRRAASAQPRVKLTLPPNFCALLAVCLMFRPCAPPHAYYAVYEKPGAGTARGFGCFLQWMKDTFGSL